MGFRQFLQDKAREHKISGLATNEQDGSLVVLLAGDGDAIGKLEALLHQGPPSARVVAVTELLLDENEIPPQGEFLIR